MYIEFKICGNPAKEDCLSNEAIEKATETIADYMRMIRNPADVLNAENRYGEIMKMGASIKLSLK